jgi:hypothetical protein
MTPRNPFIYGRAVSGRECVPREAELHTVFSRLRNGESTAVIGEPHIGKTSFLLQLTDSGIQRDYLDDDDRRLFFAMMDLHAWGDEETPLTFWREALAPLSKLRLQSVQTAIEKAAASQYSRPALEALFGKLAGHNCLLVLLLDEFERLLKHPRFKDPGFFGLLRGLSTHTGGLALVLASRLRVTQLNELGRGLLDTGSPYFNHTVDILLPPFRDDEIQRLLERAEPPFSEEERLFIRRAAGRNPYLLQAMAATLYETRPGPNRCEQAAETFYRRAAQSYFDDLWNWMDDETRTIAVILALQELGGRWETLSTSAKSSAWTGTAWNCKNSPSAAWRNTSKRAAAAGFGMGRTCFSGAGSAGAWAAPPFPGGCAMSPRLLRVLFPLMTNGCARKNTSVC